MVKFTVTDATGRRVIAFGLSRGNIRRLTAGAAVRVAGDTLGEPGAP